MSGEFRVRRLEAGDEDELRALDARTRNPYRDEDAAEVVAMHRRALQARDAGQCWSPLPADERHVAAAEHRALWVAVPLACGSNEIIGTVGLRVVGDTGSTAADTAESSGLAVVPTWIQAGDVGEVRRLRVSPDWRRRGVATALIGELISWSTIHRQRLLVLNTTAAQLPALALYADLGFREIGRSYLDMYELVWMQRPITSIGQT